MIQKDKVVEQIEHLCSRRWKLEQLGRICLRELINALNCDECSIMQISGQNVIMLAKKGVINIKKDVRDDELRLYFERTKKSIITGDVANSPLVHDIPYGSNINSLMYVPVMVNGKVKGLVYIGSYAKNAFRDDDLRFTEKLIEEVAPAFEFGLPEQSGINLVDEITGAYSRTTFDLDIKDILRSENKPVSVILIDVDYFQKYNEFHGESAANQLLKRLTESLTGNLRALDRLYRYSSTELVVILETVNKSQSFMIARRLASLIMNTRFVGEEESQPHKKITISAGIATYPEDGSNAESLMKSAYTALFRAEESGGNAVQSSGETN